MTDIAKLGLEVDSRQVRKADKDLNKLDKTGKKVEKSSDQMSAGFKRMAGVLTVLASGAYGLSKITSLHRDFTKSISELSAITGAVGEDLEFYKDKALELGSTTTFAASEVSQAFKLMASAKPDLLVSKDALASVTAEVLTLAEASGLDLATAANALGGSLNQFSAGADQASRFINVLAAGAKFGASEINNTAEAMKTVGAVASTIGLTFEQTNSAIQALASVSIKGSEAGTGLRGVLLKLSTQSKNEFNPEIVGLEAAIKNLADAELSTTQLTKLFGQESITAAAALIKQADSLSELTDKLTGTATAYDQARTSVDNFDGDIKEMNSSLEAAGLLFGEVLDPALRSSAQLGTFFGKAFQEIAIITGDAADQLGAYAAAAAALFRGEISQAGTIIDLRNEEALKNAAKIDQIWEEKKAQEALDLELDRAIAQEEELIRIDDQRIKRSKAIEKQKKAQADIEQKSRDKAKKAADDFIASLKVEADTYGLSEIALKRYEVAAKNLTGTNKTLADGYVNLIEQKIRDEELAEAAAEAYDKESASRKEANDKINASIKSTREWVEQMEFEITLIGLSNEQRDKAIQLRDLENKSLETGVDLIGKYSERISAVYDQREAQRKFIEEQEKTAEKQQKIWEDTVGQIQGHFSDNFFDIMQGNFDSLGDGFKAMLDRMIADALSAQLTQSLFGSQGSPTGLGSLLTGGGGIFGGLFGGGGSSASPLSSVLSFEDVFAGNFANGGSFTVGGQGGIDNNRIGLNVSRGERVTVETPQQQRSGGITNNITFMVQGALDKRSQQQAAGAVFETTARAAGRNK